MSSTIDYDSVSFIIEELREVSFLEKRDKGVDHLLDGILDLKASLTAKSEFLENLVEQFEQISWIPDPDEKMLKRINDLIALAKDFYTTLVRHTAVLDGLIDTNIAVPEINRYKFAVDDLREAFFDLESVFFYLPNIPDFLETTKLIAAL
jgi:hypothetical protein